MAKQQKKNISTCLVTLDDIVELARMLKEVGNGAHIVVTRFVEYLKTRKGKKDKPEVEVEPKKEGDK